MAFSFAEKVPGRKGAMGAWDWMGKSQAGVSLQRGITESFGWHTGKTTGGAVVNEGFLGWKTVARENWADHLEGRLKKGNLATKVGEKSTEDIIKNLRTNPGSAKASHLFKGGKGAALKMGGKFAMKAFPLAMTGMFAYQGYKEGGITGAVGGVAESIAYSAAFHYMGATLSNPLTWIVAGGAAVGVGAYAAGEKAQAYRRGMKTLEMGANVVDPFGTAATLRQRSLMALQNSKINGRMGLGNEALIMHRSF